VRGGRRDWEKEVENGEMEEEWKVEGVRQCKNGKRSGAEAEWRSEGEGQRPNGRASGERLETSVVSRRQRLTKDGG